MSNLTKISLKNLLHLFLFKGFIADIFFAYKGLRTSFHNQLEDSVNEGRLLAYSFFISFVFFLQRLPLRFSQKSEYVNEINLIDMIGIDLFASIFFVPIFLYIVSFFLHIFCLPFGSKATFSESRLAFFWATIVYSPILLLLSLIEGIFYNFWTSWFLNFFSIFCYSWIFSSIFCCAHKFLSNLYLFLFLITFYLFFTLINNI